MSARGRSTVTANSSGETAPLPTAVANNGSIRTALSVVTTVTIPSPIPAAHRTRSSAREAFLSTSRILSTTSAARPLTNTSSRAHKNALIRAKTVVRALKRAELARPSTTSVTAGASTTHTSAHTAVSTAANGWIRLITTVAVTATIIATIGGCTTRGAPSRTSSTSATSRVSANSPRTNVRSAVPAFAKPSHTR